MFKELWGKIVEKYQKEAGPWIKTKWEVTYITDSERLVARISVMTETRAEADKAAFREVNTNLLGINGYVVVLCEDKIFWLQRHSIKSVVLNRIEQKEVT